MYSLKFFLTATIIAGFLLFTPLMVHRLFMPIEFNQFMIQKLYKHYGTITNEERKDMFLSMYSSGFNIIFNKQPKEKPDFNDELSVFEYVFSYIPPYAIVYPTEEFYYFSFFLENEKHVAGNLRLADLGTGQGKIGMAYFVPNDQDYKLLDLTGMEGIKVEKKHDYLYRVTYKNKSVIFKIPDEIFDPPKSMKMLLKERFLGRVHDEAGVRFLLFFNYENNQFYFVLDEEYGVADKFVWIDKNHVGGKRTDFVYFVDRDYDRKILVGVNVIDIAENNFLDGPADQVPFKINIREYLNRFNPGTMLGQGLDKHGVVIERDRWMRIAISPYVRYRTYDDVLNKTNNCLLQDFENKSILWGCLTREFWNTPQWRESMIERLEEEGKAYPY